MKAEAHAAAPRAKARAPAPFAARVLRWFDRHGRHDLPWQHPRTPYRVWLAEVMLQQTQVATVLPYFGRFLDRFPTVEALAAAPADDVLAAWSGLGYYARARNLHRCAQVLVERHGGALPRELAAITALPGIGRSTGAAILAQAFGARHAILDANVRRVLARHGAESDTERLWAQSERCLPRTRIVDYTQAIMDLGATVCTARQPACNACPLRADCAALAQDRVAELPARAPRRTRPQRSARLLLIENTRGEILLERRPDTGLWGGLWSPPILWPEERRRSRDGKRTPPAIRGAKLPTIHHSFTHFDLALHPLHIRSSQEPTGAQRWTTIRAATELGLPAPIRRFLESRP